MKMYGGADVQLQLFLALAMHLVVSGHFQGLDALRARKEPRYSWNRRSGGARAGRLGEEESFLHLPEIESYFFHSLFTNRLYHSGSHSLTAVS